MNKAEKAIAVLKAHYGADSFVVDVELPFRALIGCILSQRTRDANAARAVEALFNVATTPAEMLALDQDTLKRLIRSSGYYNQKARHITGACAAVVDRFGGETPRKREDLMTLPGVGPKTADIVLSYGYDEPSIAVDTHIFRTSRRLGLAPSDSKPTEVKKTLESALPRRDWRFADGALQQLGKDYCRQTKPKCGECPLRKECEYQP